MSNLVFISTIDCQRTHKCINRLCPILIKYNVDITHKIHLDKKIEELVWDDTKEVIYSNTIVTPNFSTHGTTMVFCDSYEESSGNDIS